MTGGAPRRAARRLGGLGIVLAGSLAVCFPAAAITMQARLERACATDVDRVCPEVRSDPDALKACMLRHRALVSDACLKMIDASE